MKKISSVTENIYVQTILIAAAVVWTLGLKTSNAFAVILLVLLYGFLKTEEAAQSGDLLKRFRSCTGTGRREASQSSILSLTG